MPSPKPPKRPAIRPAAGAIAKLIPRKRRATPATPKPVPFKPAAPVAPETKATARRAEALITRIFALDERIKSDFYEMGVVLRELNAPEMYRSLGFRSFRALIEARALPKRAMAYRLIEIVDNLDKATAHTLGVERSYHVIKYAQQKAHGTPVKEFIRKNPTFRFRDQLYQLRTAPTRILRDLIVHLKTGAPQEPPPALATTARSLGQIFHHLGLEAAHVSSHHRGDSDYLTIKLSLADAKKLKNLLK